MEKLTNMENMGNLRNMNKIGITGNMTNMEKFELTMAQQMRNGPTLWIRYMDDVFSLIPQNSDHNELLRELNSVAPTIDFTVELENMNILPFLDCTVHRYI